MAQFPFSEADMVALARSMASGLEARPDVFPSPPVNAAALEALIAGYGVARGAMVEARAAAAEATADKNRAAEHLREAMKSVLRYAENVTDFDDDRLKLLGWGGRRPRRPLKAPGQTGALEAVREGPGWVLLRWKAPRDGGKVRAYRIDRRASGETDWREAGMALHPEITLENQPRGLSMAYRVVAVNRAGAGLPGNEVAVVL